MMLLRGSAWARPASPLRVARRWGSKFGGRQARTDGLPRSRAGDAPYVPPGSFPKDSNRRNYQMFESVVLNSANALFRSLGPYTRTNLEYRSFNILSQGDLDRETAFFKSSIAKAFKRASEHGEISRQQNPLFWNLRNAFVRGETRALASELKYAFQSCMLRNQLPKYVVDMQQDIADFRYPYEWFPATRMMQRTIHLHVGPTNSGKTYNALKALESAGTGIYAGPLRLLAHEIYARFTAKGLPCALVTGEELRIPEGVDQYFRSCTVEMAPLNEPVDVAVVDEIQMIADPDRGWAWTQAFLGIQARELHLCGEERAVDIIQNICARIGDQCHVHRYKRLNPLRVMKKSLGGSFDNLRKGDAMVSFTRVGIHALKAGIEKETGYRCAIVYGSLPPETRVQQAALFNDPNNDYDILVASDAIGMGLNLEIKRVVFEGASKFDGGTHRLLTVPELKQIGGRAGRYRTASQAVTDAAAQEQDSPDTVPAASSSWGSPGFVTSLEDADLPLIEGAFETEAPPITSLGVQAPNFIVENFASHFPPNTPFAYIISRLGEMSRVADRFHMTDINVKVKTAEHIHEFPMSIEDRTIFLAAPVSLNTPQQVAVLKACARCVSENRDGHLLDLQEIDMEILDVDLSAGKISSPEYLHRLENLHKSITLYLWLSYRYRGVFSSLRLAFHVKTLVEGKITEYLETLNFVSADQARRRAAARLRAEMHRAQQEAAFGNDNQDPDHDPDEVPDEVRDGEEPLVGGMVEEKILQNIATDNPSNKDGDRSRV